MNVSREEMEQYGYRSGLERMEMFVGRIFSRPAVLHICNTYQFDDYSKYRAERFSEPEKAAWRDSHFPLDLAEAGRMGAAMVTGGRQTV